MSEQPMPGEGKVYYQAPCNPFDPEPDFAANYENAAPTRVALLKFLRDFPLLYDYEQAATAGLDPVDYEQYLRDLSAALLERFALKEAAGD